MHNTASALRLLLFAIGMGYNAAGHESNKCDADPRERLDNVARVSKYESDVDPWEEVNNKINLIEKNQAIVWDDDCN